MIFPMRLVIQSYSSLSVFWMRPGQFSRPFIVSFMRMSHPVRKKKVQNCTEWTIYYTGTGYISPQLCCRFWRTYWTWNHQGSHQNITNTVLVQQMNHRMTKISIYHSKLNFKKSLILGHTSVRMGIRAPSVAHSLQTRWFSEYVYIADDPFSSNENASSGLRCSDSASRAYDLMVDVLAT